MSQLSSSLSGYHHDIVLLHILSLGLFYLEEKSQATLCSNPIPYILVQEIG